MLDICNPELYTDIYILRADIVKQRYTYQQPALNGRSIIGLALRSHVSILFQTRPCRPRAYVSYKCAVCLSHNGIPCLSLKVYVIIIMSVYGYVAKKKPH